MYNVDEYIDPDEITACRKQFKNVYGVYPSIIAVSADKTCLIAKCDFPDGEFYFRVNEDSVSESFRTMREADTGRHDLT